MILPSHSPVPGVFREPAGADGFVLGMVMPTSAVMPRRHEPVCEMTGFFLPDTLLSDSSDMSEGFRLHLEPGSIFTPLSEPPSDFLMSSPDHREFLSTWECFSASVCGQTLNQSSPRRPRQSRDEIGTICLLCGTVAASSTFFSFFFFFSRNNKQGRKRLRGWGQSRPRAPRGDRQSRVGGDGKASPNPAACACG